LNADKTFAGVVVASLDPGHLTKFYDKIDLGTLASISLIGSDGVVRSSGGTAGGFTLGQDLKASMLFAHMRAGSSPSTFEDPDRRYGEARLITVRKVKGHPLWVSVSTNQSEIYKGSWNDFQLHTLAALALTLVILMAMERILKDRGQGKAQSRAAPASNRSFSCVVAPTRQINCVLILVKRSLKVNFKQ
jgi:hypothetical protein